MCEESKERERELEIEKGFVLFRKRTMMFVDE